MLRSITLMFCALAARSAAAGSSISHHDRDELFCNNEGRANPCANSCMATAVGTLNISETNKAAAADTLTEATAADKAPRPRPRGEPKPRTLCKIPGSIIDLGRCEFVARYDHQASAAPRPEVRGSTPAEAATARLRSAPLGHRSRRRARRHAR